MVGVDLFAGVGGMSLGARWAGISVKIAIENDPHAVATHRANHPDIKLIDSDIKKVEKIPIGSKEQLIIFGGPPCRGFSTSNQKTRHANNPHNELYKEFLRFIRLLQPEWVVFENVKGILETDNGSYIDEILTALSSCGYTLSYGLLNAADFGVPQSRYRLFIVGSRQGVKFNLPKSIVKKAVTVQDAIADLPLLENGASVDRLPYKKARKSNYSKSLRGNLQFSSNHLVTRNQDTIIERFRYVPPGGNWENIPEELMQNYANRERCHTGIYHRLDPSKPSKVIGNYRKNMLIHPYQDRGLSVREAARLQSFPDWFEFKGSIGFQQQQVGNAVPPLLAKAIFTEILKYSE